MLTTRGTSGPNLFLWSFCTDLLRLWGQEIIKRVAYFSFHGNHSIFASSILPYWCWLQHTVVDGVCSILENLLRTPSVESMKGTRRKLQGFRKISEIFHNYLALHLASNEVPLARSVIIIYVNASSRWYWAALVRRTLLIVISAVLCRVLLLQMCNMAQNDRMD